MRAVPIGLALGALFLAGAAPTLAQTVSGTLVEEGTGRPVAGAYVLLLGADSVTRGGTRTDSAGAWSVRVPRRPEVYALRVQKAGYRTVETSWFEVGDEPLALRLETRPEVVMMEEITSERLTYEAFVSRRERRMGIGLGPDQIAARMARIKPRDTARLLWGILPAMGASPVTGQLAIPRRAGGRDVCAPVILLDGVRQRPRTRWVPLDINEVVPVWEIRAVEIYHEPAFIPTELGLKFTAFASCGAVAIWTYRGIGEQ